MNRMMKKPKGKKGKEPDAAPTPPAGPETVEQVQRQLAAAERSATRPGGAGRRRSTRRSPAWGGSWTPPGSGRCRCRPAPPPAALKFREAEVPLDKVRSTGNHRELDDEVETQRLARTLQTLGLQQRVGVRDAGDGSYELIFGSRRTAAARSIGWEKIPAKVYPAGLTCAEVEILRTIENFGRRDLSPVERAIAVARTIDAINATLEPLEFHHRRLPVAGELGPEFREMAGSIDVNKAFAHDPAMREAARLSQAIEAAGGLEAYVGLQLG